LKLLLDTNIIIDFLKNDNDVFDLTSLLLQHECFTSVIVKLELLKFPGIILDEENAIKDFLRLIPVIPLNLPIEDETIIVSRSTKLKLPDAIIAATAILYNAEIVTDDEHFFNCNYDKLKIWQKDK